MIPIPTCAEERSEPEKGIYIGYRLVVRKRAIATVVGAKPGSVNDQLQQRLYGGWVREGRLQCKSSVSGARSSSLLQLPVLGGAWWEGQVEQGKAWDPKNTFVMVAALSFK